MHHQSGKREALGVTGQTPEGATEAKSQEPTALSVPGRTLQDNIDTAKPDPADNNVVYSVNPTASYSIQGHIQGTPAIFLVDTGSVISIVKSALWTQSDPQCQQLTPYTGCRLVGVEGTPLSVRGKTTAEVSFGSERFQVPVIVVDQLSADVIFGLDFLEDHRCTIDIASRVLCVGGSQLRLPLVTGRDRSAPEDHSELVTVSIVKTVQVPPMSEMEIGGEVKQLVSGTWVVERVSLKARWPELRWPEL